MPHEPTNVQISKLAAGTGLLLFTGALLMLIFAALRDEMKYSYDQAICTVLNATIVERGCCSSDSARAAFDIKWTVFVQRHALNDSQYLAELRKYFGYYYEARETLATTHLVSFLIGIDVCIDSFRSRSVPKTTATFMGRTNIISIGNTITIKSGLSQDSFPFLSFA